MYSTDELKALSKYLTDQAAALRKEDADKRGVSQGTNIQLNNTSIGNVTVNIGGGQLLGDPTDAAAQAEKLETFQKQLEVIHYNPLLFMDIIKRYDVDYDLMGLPLEELPLHINDPAIVAKTIVHWRLDNGK